MIVAALVLLLIAAALLLAVTWFGYRLARFEMRFVAVTTCLDEARMLASARIRLRRRQQRMHEVFDSSATGLEMAHRVLATYLGGNQAATGERAYAWARAANDNVRQVLSAWLAPRTTTPGAQPRERDKHE